MRTVSRVKNSQSRHKDELTIREENDCSTPYWVRQNLHSSHCVDRNNTLVDLAEKESDVTKEKLKTARGATK